MRKLEEKEIIGISRQITELTELHQELISKEIEVNPYTMMLVSNDIRNAIENYKMELNNKTN